jgi:hypothetical protein
MYGGDRTKGHTFCSRMLMGVANAEAPRMRKRGRMLVNEGIVDVNEWRWKIVP